ncbi:MAG: hypothetical protein AAF431_04755 [Pseudomonadota bacterium]
MKIDHINISAPKDDLEQEKQFFSDALGLKEGFRPNFSSNGYWLYSEGKALVHLTESNNHFKNESQGFLDHIAFDMTGSKELIKRLTDLNIPHKIKFLSENSMTQVFFKSPSGIGLEANFLNETSEYLSE